MSKFKVGQMVAFEADSTYFVQSPGIGKIRQYIDKNIYVCEILQYHVPDVGTLYLRERTLTALYSPIEILQQILD